MEEDEVNEEVELDVEEDEVNGGGDEGNERNGRFCAKDKE